MSLTTNQINFIERSYLRLNAAIEARGHRLAEIEKQAEMAETTEEIQAVFGMLSAFKAEGHRIEEEMEFYREYIREKTGE